MPSATAKRYKPTPNIGGTAESSEHHSLLPGLPDDLVQIFLSTLPPSLLYSVCRPWRRLLYSTSFPPFLSLYALLSTTADHPSIEFQSYNPISSSWHHLPPPPPHSLDHLRRRHPSFLSRDLPIQSVSVSGQLILISATATRRLLPALTRPLIFDPSTSRWRFGPQLPFPRRWCAAGSANGAVYVASCVGTEYSPDIARSAERWDLGGEGKWEKLSSLADGRFSREAIDAVGARGKLFMVNAKGSWAKEGVVYNIAADKWEPMQPGMVLGWTGLAAAAEEETIYALEEKEGVVWEYEWGKDKWRVVMASELLKGAVQVTAGGGRVCAVVDGGAAVAVVDVGKRKVWMVRPPDGKQFLAVHVLPRMSRVGS